MNHALINSFVVPLLPAIGLPSDFEYGDGALVRLYFPKAGGTPSYKRYLDEMPGVALQNDWGDIKPVPPDEYLGYQTQKPLALLERIINSI